MIFLSFFFLLRSSGIPVSIREWIDVLKVLSLDGANCQLDRLYHILRCLLIKKEALYDRFDQCFLHYFKDMPQGLLDQLHDDLKSWLAGALERPNLSAKDFEALEKLDLESLQKQFEERLKEQKEQHDGGSYWIGRGGRSPFGHSGQHPSGIRVGGESQRRSAIKVAQERRFQAYRHDRTLDIRQMSTVLRKLRLLSRASNEKVIDINQSIHYTAKNDGELEIVLEEPKTSQLHLVLLMDVGGTMDPYADLVAQFFSAAHQSTHFKSFHAYYFHNCIYDCVYEDANFTKSVDYAQLYLGQESHTRVVIVGDACMSPYEVFSPMGRISSWESLPKSGAEYLKEIVQRFPKSVWLNPLPKIDWAHMTIKEIKGIFKMFELNLDGLNEAVKFLVKL
jgi:uncharacterized protein with von Willebrand factor type A (vWA) domain